MKKILFLFFSVTLSCFAAEITPAHFTLLKTGNFSAAEITEPEAGKLTMQLTSAAKNNYIVACHNCNVDVNADTVLSYTLTPDGKLGDGAQFTASVCFVKPGEKKWNNVNARGTLLFRENKFSYKLTDTFKIPVGSKLRQIKFVFNGMKTPVGKDIKVTVSNIKLVTPDAK